MFSFGCTPEYFLMTTSQFGGTEKMQWIRITENMVAKDTTAISAMRTIAFRSLMKYL